MTTGKFYNPIYGNGTWVISCTSSSNDNGLYYSTNGQTWTQSNMTTGYSRIVAYLNGLWLTADGGYSGKNPGLWYSEDGKTWVQSNWTNYSFNDFAYTGNYYLACSGSYEWDGGILYSTDGKNWIKSDASGRFSTLTCGENIVLASPNGDQGIWYSTSPFALNDHIHVPQTTCSGTYTATLSSGTSNTTVDVSSYITDTTNFVYQVAIISAGGNPISAAVDPTAKKAMFARGAGVSATTEITITFKILKIKIT
jgi:hypothetical protein